MAPRIGWRRGVFLLSLLSSVALSQAPPRRQFSIVVYDAAGIGTKTLERTEHFGEVILSASGLPSIWSAGKASDLASLGTDFTARTTRECLVGPIPPVLRVRVLRTAPPGVAPQTLGFSLPCARAGVPVTIYADHAATVSQAGGPTFCRVLAYAIVHELGHVLLRSEAHEASGLMKAIWSKGDWQRAAVSFISFTPVDVRRIVAFDQPVANGNIAP